MNIVNLLLNKLLAINVLCVVLVGPHLILLIVLKLSVVGKYKFKPITATFFFAIYKIDEAFTGEVFKVPNETTQVAHLTLCKQVNMV